MAFLILNCELAGHTVERIPFFCYSLQNNKKVKGSVLGRAPSSILVSWKSVQWILCNSADEPTNKQTNKQTDMCDEIYPPPWRCQKQKSGSADGFINLRDGEGAVGFQVDPGCV